VRRPAPLVLIVVVFAIAGCGSADQDKTPVACLSGPRAFTDALREAPGAVQLAGGTLISACIVPNQSAGDLANVGGTLVKVSTELNSEARAKPGGPANVELGYLIGAVNRGAADTTGIHAELVRRLAVAANFSPGGAALPSPFRREYEKGYAAGKDHG
jgi:hypothetical protein